MPKDYYKILNVERKSTEEEIRKSYKKLALQFHPDKNPGDDTACEKFKEISEAYSVLGNKEKKSQYDIMGSVDDSFEGEDPFSVFNNIFKDHINTFMNMKYDNDINIGNLFGAMPGMANSFGNVHIRVHTFPTDINSFQNIEEDFYNEPRSFFNDLLPPQKEVVQNNIRKVKILHQKPEDIIYNIKVSLADIYNLVKKNITITRTRKVDGKYIQKKKKIEIPIYGKEILLEKEGNELKNYKERGNIIINIFNEPSDSFKRINDYDLLTFKEINVNQLYTSFVYDIELPNNNVLKIQSESMIKDNSTFLLQKVNKKGLPFEDENHNLQYGNLYIKYKIIFPKSIDELKNIKEYNENSNIKDDYQVAYNCLFDEIFKNE